MASIPVSYTLAVLCLMSVLFSCDGFSLKGFCASNCARGMGGNVCKCNGFHFAGKRGNSSPDNEVYSDSSRDSKAENFLELDSNGFGMFGYPKVKEQERSLRNTNSHGQFGALLEKYLAERYSRGKQFESNPNNQAWQD